MTTASIPAGATLAGSPRALFRTLAIAEAVSWTLLIGGLVLRAVTDWGLGVTIGGGIHGFVFLAYGATAVLLTVHQRWGAGAAVLAIGSAIVPYATIPVERWLARTGRLDGPWRLEATDDPRDARPLDRLVRTLLRHPVLLALALLVAVAALFTVLLIVGPPGGR